MIFMSMFAHLLGKKHVSIYQQENSFSSNLPFGVYQPQSISCKPYTPIPSNSSKKIINISEDFSVAQGVIVGGYMARRNVQTLHTEHVSLRIGPHHLHKDTSGLSSASH